MLSTNNFHYIGKIPEYRLTVCLPGSQDKKKIKQTNKLLKQFNSPVKTSCVNVNVADCKRPIISLVYAAWIWNIWNDASYWV